MDTRIAARVAMACEIMDAEPAGKMPVAPTYKFVK